MGQDVSVIFLPQRVSDEALLETAKRAFADNPPLNLVLLIASDAPPSVEVTFPEFTAISLWTDTEEGLAKFASQLSSTHGTCVIVTMTDHACIGGWQIFQEGNAGCGNRVEGAGYTTECMRGIEVAFDVKLPADEESELFFTEAFLEEPTGLCVFGSAQGFEPGKRLNPEQVLAILEYDVPDAGLECLMDVP